MKRIVIGIFTFCVCLLLILCSEAESTTDLAPPAMITPANGDTITANPPSFIWNAVPDDNCDLIYRIEVATDSNFGMSSIIISSMVPLPDTVYRPANVLSAGTYYWHLCVRQNA